jgi:Large polyvalent protein associated domain 29
MNNQQIIHQVVITLEDTYRHARFIVTTKGSDVIISWTDGPTEESVMGFVSYLSKNIKPNRTYTEQQEEADIWESVVNAYAKAQG